MKIYIMILLVTILTFCSCSVVETPMSNNEIMAALQEIKEDSGQICVMADPMTAYEVRVTDAFIATLDINAWQNVSSDVIRNNTAFAMLYFDLVFSEDKTDFTCVAILSNNNILAQICTEDGFGESCWYMHSSNKEIYDDLLAFVLSH